MTVTVPSHNMTLPLLCPFASFLGVILAQLVKASVGKTEVCRFKPHLSHNWSSCSVFLVKYTHFGLPLAQTKRLNWQSV